MEKPAIYDKSVETFLDLLRESGVTNMYGAAPYLQKHLGLSKSEAKECLLYWMGTFKEEKKEKKS